MSHGEVNLHARRIVIGSAATVLLISGFAAVSQAQSSSPSPRPPQGEGPQGDGPHGGPRGGHDGFGRFGGIGRFGGDLGLARGPVDLVHGTGVVKDKDGTYVTESVQKGKASAISTTSLTVTSDDGFKLTYVLTSSTKGTAKDATTVTVIAKQTGSTWTAQAVLTPGDHPKGFGPGGHRPGQPKPTSSASPTAGA